MDEPISYKEYIPTDRWSLQDWYLTKMARIERLYSDLREGWYSGGLNRRILVKLMAEVAGFVMFSKENFKTHLTETEIGRLSALLYLPPDRIDMKIVEEVATLVSSFLWKSGVSKLTDSTPLGPFAYARERRGLSGGRSGDAE